MVTTFGQLTDQIISNLQGFTISPNQVTFVTGSMGTTDLTFVVDDITQMGKGLAEIDSEIVYIKAIDTTSATCTIAPFGRGYSGSTAATHAANTAVVMSPDWPRSKVKAEINRVVGALYPTLFAVKDAGAITTDGITYQFDVPADCERVVDVRYQWDTLDGWQRAVKWEMESQSPAGFGATGRYVSIRDCIPAGSSVQVLYAARPTAMSADADVFATTTGLADSVTDVVIYAVMSRLVQFIDIGRLAIESASADALAQQKPTGTPTQISTQLYRQYLLRLAEEQRALTQLYPVRGHKVR